MVDRMVKLKVYIKTFKISPLDVSNVLTLGHACDSPGERISAGTKHLGRESNAWVSDESRKAIDFVDQISKENGVDYEIVDLSKAGLMTKLKFLVKGWKVPVIRVGNEAIMGLPTKEQLEALL